MIKRLPSLIAAMIVAAAFVTDSSAVDAASTAQKLCPITGKPANPAIATEYEGQSYAFADEAAKEKFIQARKDSLYQKLGGKAALDAVVDRFYEKIVADKRINHLFEDINMRRQIRKQKEFLAAAFGGPIPWTGKDLRKAHANIPGLNETHFNAVAEHLQSTLVEFKVDQKLIDQVMAIAEGARAHVLQQQAGK